MENDNIISNINESSPLTFGKLTLYGVEIVFIIQLLMVVLNYSKNWRDEQGNNTNLEESSSYNNVNESSQISSFEKNYESMELLNSENENYENSTFSLKKILTFISVLPLSSFYLLLKLSYNIIKIAVYNLFDSIIYFVDYWILNFPERFEEYIVNFFGNYIFRGINYITEKFIIPLFLYSLNTIKNVLNKVFSEENYDKAVYYIGKFTEYIYDRIIVPCFESFSIYSVKLFNNFCNFIKEYSVKFYNFGVLLINTITIFTLDFFEDVQVAWSGIQWFGINIAQPAASFLEDILLTLTIRPLAYSIAFFKVLIEKTAILIYKGIIALALLLPSLISIASIYIYKKFNLERLRRIIHRWMCRWVYLPLWYIVYFAVNYGEKLVIDYIPRAYHACLRLMTYLFSKLVILFNILMEYLKVGLIYTYQFLEKVFNFVAEYIPYAHKRALKLSKDIYKWMKLNVFPWIDTFKHIFYDLPLSIGKSTFIFVKTHVFSEDSFIGKNSRIVIKLSKQLGEFIFTYMVQIGLFLKTFMVNMLNIIAPHVVVISQKIIDILHELSIKLYDTLKPICKKEMEFMIQLAEKEFNQLGILIKNLLKELKQKIGEIATYIHQSLISENKKLHQSYASKKEFNKEFLHKSD